MYVIFVVVCIRLFRKVFIDIFYILSILPDNLQSIFGVSTVLIADCFMMSTAIANCADLFSI